MLLHHLELFATEGLRTLCCAYAELDEDFYNQWKAVYNKASCSLIDREGVCDHCLNAKITELYFRENQRCCKFN